MGFDAEESGDPTMHKRLRKVQLALGYSESGQYWDVPVGYRLCGRSAQAEPGTEVLAFKCKRGHHTVDYRVDQAAHPCEGKALVACDLAI